MTAAVAKLAAAILSTEKGRKAVGWIIVAILSPLILFFRIKKYYIPGKSSRETIKALSGAIIAANHTGFSDPFILNAAFWYRRFYYTASEQVMSGFKGKLLKAAGCVKIDRTIADLEGIKKCVNILKDGYLLGMFPHGHINGEDVKGGVVLIAAMAGAPVVPVYIQKRKHWWQRHRMIFAEPVNVKDHMASRLPSAAEISDIGNMIAERINEGREYVSMPS